MSDTNFTPLTTDEILSHIYGNQNDEDTQFLEKILSKIPSSERVKAKTAIEDFLNNSGIMADIYYLDCFLQNEKPLEYAEFSSLQDANDYLSKSKKILNIVLILLDDMEMLDVKALVDLVEEHAANKETSILATSSCDYSIEENKKLLRILIQSDNSVYL